MLCYAAMKIKVPRNDHDSTLADSSGVSPWFFYPHTLRVHTPDFPRLIPHSRKTEGHRTTETVGFRVQNWYLPGGPVGEITLRRRRFRPGHQQRSTKCRFCCQRTPGGNGTGVSDSCVRWGGWNGGKNLGVKIHGELWCGSLNPCRFSIWLGLRSYRTGDGRLLWWLGFRTLCNFQSDAGVLSIRGTGAL